ncbi:MAG: hypothetical protein LBR60_01145 [Fibrobacter sp.]|jgi:hypothetical protein|nr:hypothetical protein [Fibrobacter sp.]
MSLFSFEKPGYAETHYKFKLPWSLLYRPFPEIIIDAPFQVIPGRKLTLLIAVRDADKFPAEILSLTAEIKDEHGTVRHFEQKLSIHVNRLLDFFPVELPALPAGKYRIDPKLSIRAGKKEKTITRWNLPGLKPAPLLVQILAENPPLAPGFIAGEMHCHTHYSSDPVEFGAPPKVLQQAAADVGLDFVLTTDHAYDFAFEAVDYMKPAAPEKRFRELQKEIEKLPAHPRLIAGLEVSAGNAKKENIHLLAFNPPHYLPGLGDSGRFWFHNQPAFSVPEILAQSGAVCFAAHPKVPIGKLERLIFRRGEWNPEDLSLKSPNPVRGLQFWNGSLDRGFERGKAWWIEELEKGNRLLPIGGNDAHGDFNDTTGISLPLFSLKYSRNHVFGRVRTVVRNFGFNKTDCLYLTNGPALWWEHSKTGLTFFARSTADYGKIKSIHLFAQTEPGAKEKTVHTVSPENTFESEIEFPLREFMYARAECLTEQGLLALTSAAFPD